MAGAIFPQAGFAVFGKPAGAAGFRRFPRVAQPRAAMRRSENRPLVA